MAAGRGRGQYGDISAASAAGNPEQNRTEPRERNKIILPDFTDLIFRTGVHGGGHGGGYGGGHRGHGDTPQQSTDQEGLILEGERERLIEREK